MGIFVRRAVQRDLLLIQRLVAKAGLREEGIERQLDHFIVAKNKNDELIGTVGIETYGTDGLLRSLVLEATRWNEHTIVQFIEVVLQYTKQMQVDTVYLCAFRMHALFYALGFETVDAQAVPTSIKRSPHFKQNMKKKSRIWARSLKG